MQKVNWDEVQEAQEFDNPTPGAYIAKICQVQDVEEKEYIKIAWDFAEGEYMGNNRDTYKRAGFWPIVLIRSYKPKTLPFFKAFKTAVEESNPGYRFDEAMLDGLRGKRFGVVLGEEEYRKNDGSTGTRLYVAAARSVQAIRDGDFTVPAKKLLAAPTTAQRFAAPKSGTQGFGGFTMMDEDDGDQLPF